MKRKGAGRIPAFTALAGAAWLSSATPESALASPDCHFHAAVPLRVCHSKGLDGMPAVDNCFAEGGICASTTRPAHLSFANAAKSAAFEVIFTRVLSLLVWGDCTTI